MKKIVLLPVYLFFTVLLFAQSTDESTFEVVAVDSNIIGIVQDILVGDDIAVSNITCNVSLDNSMVGLFSNENTEAFQLQGGLVMSTGNVTDIATPNTLSWTSTNYNLGGDTDLQQMFNQNNVNVYDAVVVEFDYIPYTNVMSFDYILGSEEFPEYASSQFNDKFGFFVSGEGIEGTFSNNAVNIAQMPDGTGDVSISNIWDTPFFIDNADGQWMQFDGYTSAFNANLEVVPFTTYHIKLAVGDAGDGEYDTGIFIGKKSFRSMPLHITTHAGEGFKDNEPEAVEGTIPVIIDVELPAIAQQDITYTYQILGDAENGVDYQTISNEITIPAGSQSASIVINPLQDDLEETTEQVMLVFDMLNDTVAVDILDNTGVLGVQDVNNVHFNVYPNPSNGSFNVQLNGQEYEKVVVNIYSMDGREVYREKLSDTDGLRIDNLKTDKGVYFIKITTDTFSAIRKIIIE